jgi:hypothetical protein
MIEYAGRSGVVTIERAKIERALTSAVDSKPIGTNTSGKCGAIGSEKSIGMLA